MTTVYTCDKVGELFDMANQNKIINVLTQKGVPAATSNQLMVELSSKKASINQAFTDICGRDPNVSAAIRTHGLKSQEVAAAVVAKAKSIDKKIKWNTDNRRLEVWFDNSCVLSVT